MMKKYAFLILSVLFFCTSCSDNEDDVYKTFGLTVQLVYPSDSELNTTEGVAVKLTSNTGTAYDATTDANGKASFTIPAGIYEASASETRALDGYSYILNGVESGITITDAWTGEEPVKLTLTEAKSGQVIIKEVYVGGCLKDDGSGSFYNDKYVILYNNSAQSASLQNLCFGMTLPLNAHGTNNNYVDGKLSYESEGFIPAGYAIWHFPNTLELQPGEQVVVAIMGAIDHSQTYSNSVNLSNSSYYCMYDTEDFDNTTTYPTPSESIPTSHYLLAEKYGQGNAWPIGQNGPGIFIFTTKDVSPAAYASNTDNQWNNGGSTTLANRCVKVPNEWILDGVEVYSEPNLTKSQKRLTAAVDAGYTLLTNARGRSSYRNVNKEATEALEENSGKLVYNYSFGTEDSTDPSGIDAEASLKNGARIIYKDTNNSTNDFHQRSQASLRD